MARHKARAPAARARLRKRSGVAVPPDIRRVVGDIVQRFRPNRVILFGSRARGEAGPDSDVDLLVVMDTSLPPLHAAAEIAAAVAHPFPLDVLVYRPAQWRAALRRRSAFAREVCVEGLVLHEA
jgi:predicted nucleotidyltransferase